MKYKKEEEQTIFSEKKINEWVNKQETSIDTELKNILIFKNLVICSSIYIKQMIKKKIMNQ